MVVEGLAECEGAGFVVVHQTRRPLGELLDGLRVTTAARAAVDVALTARRRRDVDHVVADVLQKGLATVEDLAAEVRFAGRRVGPWLRDAMVDAARGMRSVGESHLRRVILAAGLPEPEWNGPLETADGAAFHLSAGDWEIDLRRQNAVHCVDVRLLRLPVRRLRGEESACGAEMWQALRARAE